MKVDQKTYWKSIEELNDFEKSRKNLFHSIEKDFCLFRFFEKNSSRVFMLFLWASSLLQLFVLVGFTLGSFISLSYYINSIQSSASFIGCIFLWAAWTPPMGCCVPFCCNFQVVADYGRRNFETLFGNL